MAEAAPPITHFRVLKIALPIVLANATVPILGLVDLNMGYQIDPFTPLDTSGGAIEDAQPGWRFQFSLGGR